jgi:hypothetical protein
MAITVVVVIAAGRQFFRNGLDPDGMFAGSESAAIAAGINLREFCSKQQNLS